MNPPGLPSTEEEPQELSRFREEWLAELNSRRGVASISGKPTLPDSVKTKSQKTSIAKTPDTQETPLQERAETSAQATQGIRTAQTAKILSPSVYSTPTPLSATLASALKFYRQAVEHEQLSELDDALVLYRQAFRMDAHVDRAYHRQEMLASILVAQQNPLHEDKTSATGSIGLTDDFTTEVKHPVLKSSEISITVTGTLSSILANFPQTLSFEPEVEGEPIPLQKLPEELLVTILRKLDPTSIERFALVNHKARLVTLDSAMWRDLVEITYKPPQVLDQKSLLLVVDRCLSDYRRVYVEHPRVRLDGVYIATCHYVRPGLSDNSWVNISHLITYHRYLRFLPNGQVLSLLVNEEHTPQQIIPILKPTLRMKGFYTGTWHLSGTTIQLSNLLDANSRPSLSTPNNTMHQALESSENTRYTFIMTLALVSRPLGRWNKLNIESYSSISLETGDINPVALKHERPFWFSKVRSYAMY